MTDSNSEIKWFYCIALLLVGGGAGWIVVQPEYNFAHWMPHSLMRVVGMSYSTILLLESNADLVLHPLIAFTLTLTLYKASIPGLSMPIYRPFTLLACLMLLAELIQWQIGRGFELADLLLGLLGSMAATCLMRWHLPGRR